MTTHRGRASDCHERYRTTRDPVDSTRERPRRVEARSSPETRTTSETIRCVSPLRVNSPHAQSRAEPLPGRSNDVGRRSRTVRRGRGEHGVVSSRDGLERCSRGGGEKGRGTGPCMRRPTTVVLRVVSVPAECRASPTVHLLDWGERVPYIEPFSHPPLDPPTPVARSTPPSLPAASSPAPSTSAPVSSRGRLGAQSRSRISERASTFAR